MDESLVKKAELEYSQKIAGEAGQIFNTTQIEVNKERIVAGERVGWFSAGAISLSFTLIGYLFSNSEAKQVFREDVFSYLPLIGLLIIGWMNLSISILASLLVRLWNASYLNYNKAQYWSSKNRESKEKALEAIAAGEELIFTGAENSDSAVKNVEESKKNYTDIEKIATHKAKFWLRALNLAQAAIYTGAIVGLSLLSLFLIVVTYRLIYL